jgi:hypothetical protein
MSDDSPAPIDRFFETLYAQRPVDATFIGRHEHDHRLPDWSPAGHEAARAAWSATRDALRTAQGPASDDQVIASGDLARIDIALAISHCDLTLAELESTHFTGGNPSLASGEVAFAIIGLITRDFLPAPQRASWLLQRLRRVPSFLAGAMNTLKGTPMPRAWRARALREADAVSALLDEGLLGWCRAMKLPDDLTRALVDAAQLASGAVHGFATALGQLPDADADVATCGEELLARCLTRGHWVARSFPDLLTELHVRLDLEQRTLADMVRDVGASSMAEVQSRLAARHPTAEEFYAAFGRVWDACRAASDHLVTWPDFPIRYVPIPRWTRMAAPSLYYLFYRSPAPFDTYDTYEYVVTPIDGVDPERQAQLLRATNDSVIKLNHVVHHGALGHHVQNWYAYRSPSRIGQVAAADCASRIAMLLGGTMAEGWACYATDLMDEVGFLTPDERVAEQQTRVRMLARAMVDIELHTGRRSFAEAVRLYTESVGMPPEAARGEVVKNSMFPGTAMMYWLGTQAIHDLRRAVSAKAGARFDLKGFHDRFLSHGAIPVAVTSRLMQQRG